MAFAKTGPAAARGILSSRLRKPGVVDFSNPARQAVGVDLLKVLLYMMVAALLAALGVSWKDFKKARAEEPKEKITEMNLQIREILEGQARMKADRERITGKAAAPATDDAAEAGPAPTLSDEELAALTAASTLSHPQSGEDGEAPMATAEQRTEAIAEAPVVAKLMEWVDDEKLGSFCVLEVKDAAAVKPGTILAIRRKGGILGMVKVGDVSPDGALANPTTKFADVKPEAGDELIVSRWSNPPKN